MTKQGTQRSNGHPIMGDLIDLDKMLAEHDLAPVPVKLAGKTYQVRRDLTGTEITECWRLINAGNDVEALAMLVSAPVLLNKALEKLPQKHMQLAVQQIFQAAGIAAVPRVEPGESSAS